MLTPVVDLNYNPDSPVTTICSTGDQPDRVARLASALIRGIQQNGVVATEAQKGEFQQAAQAIADRSITVLRNSASLPLNLEPGAKVLTVTVAQPHPMCPAADLDVFDEELRKRGFEVEHLLNPRTQELQEAAAACQYRLLYRWDQAGCIQAGADPARVVQV